MPKILSLKQLLKKKYKTLEDVPEWFVECFGELVYNFIMIIWGESANGKSNFMMQFLKALLKNGKVLYVGLEEGAALTMQLKAEKYFDKDVHSGKIRFADHHLTYQEIFPELKKKGSARFVVVDSIQYWNISYEDYKALKKAFPAKSFIFISHAKGKTPDGSTANKVRYDADLKIHVAGFVAFIQSRYKEGAPKNYVIWEQGARSHWGKKYKTVVEGIKTSKKKTT